MNTAVEWLVEQFDTTINYTLEEWQLKIEQAKAIEKNQIVLAFINGDNSDCLEEEDSLLYAIAYYNEKFKK
ncbi:hypothetical protein elemo19C_phanotate14 [Flavobacterium phage vB_FspP_elemoA_1-9C]|jgi:hypothetical protein|uniref:Uncharacterized protein n=6 Tax=Elemovirus TaxID=2948694 RepID=A0A7D7IXK8_9CAUD|nr:hypothetical protein KNV10_gp14 [Flavobacterium phage vB_FspP_elemoA_7-9A]YP_010108920.1 hypothetical protein KNV11_gp13 [Flavobacterium phage vB_FspP_elemoF_6-3D]YP_010109008.1 hypothetical protein KNV12_gp13 [Flavobacterium phage vB_FspP_elemoE_6-9C]YP_010109146.1 hypothetical protein KNV13_gp85 [Flavobacterium phage vB_FspP_elemoD_13-5B]YP_010356089.1 hypothetical protein M1M19_gp13 [Flavobacterium phage vB_FspP_elemoB_14-3B]YP_010356451.1 hypothetical protein M1M21_gp13 [Flavobacterium 